MDKIFFDSWESLVRTFTISIFAYIGLVLMLRTVGNKTLTQLNAFDFLVNVAIGSTLATVILNKNVALVDGLLAFGMLILLQTAISYLSKHSEKFSQLVKTEPVLLFYNGSFVKESMQKHYVLKSELFQVIRSEGFGSFDEVSAIVLETNGKFSVIQKRQSGGATALDNLK